MNKLYSGYLTVLLLLFSQFVTAQSYSIPELDSLEHDLLKQIKHTLDSKSFKQLVVFKKGKVNPKHDYFRNEEKKLVDSFYFNVFSIKIVYEIDASTYTEYGYEIKLIRKNDFIIYYKIEHDTTPTAFYINEDEMLALHKAYEQYYIEPLNLEVFDTIVNYTYGSNCGEAAEELLERTIMEQHLSKMNIPFFNNWLSHPSAELKVYAYEAFRRLEKQGLKLTEKQQRILKDLETDDTLVQICLGCLFDPITIREAIQSIEY
jgi:hypothetical protein